MRVRSEDLLDERGAGARQAEDENGIRILRTPATTGSEKFRRTNLDLPARIAFYDFRFIVAFLAFQRVAKPVIAERFRVFATVLQRLGERKTKVVIGRRPGRRGRTRTRAVVPAPGP